MLIVFMIPLFRHRQPVVAVTPRSKSQLLKLTNLGVEMLVVVIGCSVKIEVRPTTLRMAVASHCMSGRPKTLKSAQILSSRKK